MLLLLLLCWCFTALLHFSGNSGRGQLTYPHWSWTSLVGSLPVLMHILSPVTDNSPSWISGRKRMAVETISWPVQSPQKNVAGHENRTRDRPHTRRTRIRPSYRARPTHILPVLVKASRSWFDLLYNWPPNSELLLNNSLLELIYFLSNIRGSI